MMTMMPLQLGDVVVRAHSAPLGPSSQSKAGDFSAVHQVINGRPKLPRVTLIFFG